MVNRVFTYALEGKRGQDRGECSEPRRLNALNFDLTVFNDWFTAYVAKDASSMALAEKRFTPNFDSAFRAWLATDPATNAKSPPGPEYMPQYKQPDKALAARLNATATADYTAGAQAGANADSYILTTVYLATVLFLAGIGSHFSYRVIRYGLAGVGTAILTLAVVLRPPLRSHPREILPSQ